MNTLEWSNFIISIPEDELIETATFLGSQGFIDSLLNKNIPMKDISNIHLLVAKRFEILGRLVPQKLEGSVVNYYNILHPPL
jgi:hypothetical protein